VPPVADLKIAVPAGRRDAIRRSPKGGGDGGALWVGGSLKRLSEALGKLPR